MILNHDYVRDILLYVEKNLNYKSGEEVPTHHKKLDHSRLPDKEQFKNYDKDTINSCKSLQRASKLAEMFARN